MEVTQERRLGAHPEAWAGTNPYYMILVNDDEHVVIDLDQSGWATLFKDWMRAAAKWHLVRKDDNGVALSLWVHEGDQPYYTSRAFGSNKTDHFVRAYGIGKKQPDGTMVRVWVMENGLVCGGDDVDEFGSYILHL